MNEEKRESITECVAQAIREAELKEGQCDEQTTFVSYLPAANAAIDAYHAYIRRHS